jgi:hypothetical protein
MSETNHERTLYVRYVFRNQLISGKRVRRRYRPQEKLRLSNPEKIGVRETQLSLFLRSSESRGNAPGSSEAACAVSRNRFNAGSDRRPILRPDYVKGT